MIINLNNEFIKRLTTSLILIFLLIAIFSIGNNGTAAQMGQANGNAIDLVMGESGSTAK